MDQGDPWKQHARHEGEWSLRRGACWIRVQSLQTDKGDGQVCKKARQTPVSNQPLQGLKPNEKVGRYVGENWFRLEANCLTNVTIHNFDSLLS